MNQLLTKSLEIATAALEAQNDKDLQFTRSLELATFIMDVQAKQIAKDGVQIVEKEVIKEVPVEVVKEVEVIKEVTVEVDSQATLDKLAQAEARIKMLEAAAPQVIEKEIIKEVPVEVVKEVQVPVEVVKEVAREVEVVKVVEQDSAKTLEALKAAQAEIERLAARLNEIEAQALDLECQLEAANEFSRQDKIEIARLKALTSKCSNETAATSAPVVTDMERAAAAVNAVKGASVKVPVIHPTTDEVKLSTETPIPAPAAPTKADIRPVVRLGGFTFPEAKLFGFVFDGFVGEKKIFHKEIVNAIPENSDANDPAYAHYVAAVQAIKAVQAEGYSKVKFVSTVNLRPDQMTTVTGQKYAAIVAQKDVEVFSKVNTEKAYNDLAEKKVLMEFTGSTPKTETAPF